MSQVPEADWLAPGTPIDLDNCAREPIHVPGSIQPRGVLLAVSEPHLVVQQVSENLAALTGVAAEAALGRGLPEVLGVAAAQAVARSASAFGDLRERNPVELTLDVAGDPVPVDAILHRVVLRPGGLLSPGNPVRCPALRSGTPSPAWWSSSSSRHTGRGRSPSPTPTRRCAGRSAT